MKRFIMLLCILFSANLSGFACEVCKKQQPKILRGITHGAGPQSDWDYLIVGVTVIVVLVSLFLAVKWIMHPGEKENQHIKRSIFNMES